MYGLTEVMLLSIPRCIQAQRGGETPSVYERLYGMNPFNRLSINEFSLWLYFLGKANLFRP